ncbi:glycosyltransferase family 4 protein [Rufibacter soli]
MPLLVIDARMIDASGIGVYLRHMIPFLAEEFKVTLLGDPAKLQALEGLSQVQIIPAFAPIYSIKEQWSLVKAIPEADLFWSPHYNIPLLPIKASRRVVTIHDTYHLAYKHTLTLAQKAFATTFLNAAVRLSHQIITVSTFSKAEIQKYTQVSAAKIKVIPNGLDHDTFQVLGEGPSKEKLKQHLPALPASFILFVGNVKPHKNLKTLLQAYAALPPELQDQYKLVIVGKKDGFITPDGELTQRFQEDPTLEANCFFTGYVPGETLPLLYNSASLFVFPSVYEGFGLPPLEAMACGCPVVTSNVASIQEVCGDAALYFDPLDWKCLSQQMEKVLTHEETRDTLVQAGVKQSQTYSWQQAGQAHLQVFKEMVAPGT